MRLRAPRQVILASAAASCGNDVPSRLPRPPPGQDEMPRRGHQQKKYQATALPCHLVIGIGSGLRSAVFSISSSHFCLMPTPTSYIIYIDIHTAGPKDRGVKFAIRPAVLEKVGLFFSHFIRVFWRLTSFSHFSRVFGHSRPTTSNQATGTPRKNTPSS